ncbi:MAG: tRNA (adenosine(37)-N6)-threonylcarbamoyltransferase complex ATPase subunit type 1 TsaE [Sphingomonas sp. 28-63-12]|nr:MAG: tRNA (adenosine(37)-N6)-threonylcarbamoyltransferase complex ATPase subunit type 1 TsaE [Sphingomonas sp. 28-63-12]
MLLTDPAASDRFGAALAALVMPGDVITLAGPLGAGKTSIARGLLAALGLVGEAPSPSFAIVQPYAPPDTRLPVLHVDLYRIDDPAEINELGLDESVEEQLLIVEWPERAPPDYWPHALAISLSMAPDGGRRLTVEVPLPWRARWSRI